jgi:HK97 family phage major capsid protein
VRIKHLHAQVATLHAKAEAILKSAEAEQRGLTDPERTELTAIKDQIAKIEADIKLATDLGTAPPVSSIPDPEPQPAPRVAVSAPNSDKDPRRGFASHREFLMSAMRLATHGVEAAGEKIRALIVRDKDDRESGGEPAVMLPVAFTPPVFRATVGSDEQGEYDDRYGGFAVPKSRLPGLLQVGFGGDPTAGRTQDIPMATPVVEIMARTDKDHTTSVSGGLTVTRKPETVSATASRMSLEMVSLKANSLFGLAYATEELLNDSPMSFVAILEGGFRDQFGAHMLNEKLRGLGGSEYFGILKSLAASSLGPTISVAKEAGQVADTIVTANVIKMRARCWGYENAIWLANQDCYPQLATLSIGIGAAGVLVYQQSVLSDRPDMLLGRPIYYTEYAATVGDQGDIILANFSQYLEGIYQPLQSAESIHVRFVNHERTFKFWVRNAGAPWWRSALTPAKSSATLSPFVVADAR